MSASREQVQELANAIALQAQSIADATIDEEAVYATVKLLQGNVETLSAWTAHLSPEPAAQGKSHKPFWPSTPPEFSDLEASVAAVQQGKA